MFENVYYTVIFCPVEGRYRLRRQTKRERFAAMSGQGQQGYPKGMALRKLQEAVASQQRSAK